MLFLLLFQVKLKSLRQTYEKARSYRDRSGSSMEGVLEICPLFDELDVFLGTRPLSKPHYRATSTDLPGQTPDEHDSQVCQEKDNANTQDTVADGDNLQDSPTFEATRGRRDVQELEESQEIIPPTQCPPSRKRIKLVSPGGSKRSRKRAKLDASIAEDLNDFMKEEAAFRVG